MWIVGIIVLIAKVAVVLVVLLLLASYLVWLERKFLARLQIRYGPTGPAKFGLLQPIADADQTDHQGGHGSGRGRPHCSCWPRPLWPSRPC
jgi:hypothetical protein